MLACCLPLGIAGAAGALGLAVVLAPLRPWLIGIAILLLGVAAVQLFRGSQSCRRRNPMSLLLFGFSATVVVGVILFPQQIAQIMAAIP